MVSAERKYIYPSVLTIAGSDSGGGAGIQADLKTISSLGCYGTSAITVITAQNTLGVISVHHLPAAIVTSQINAVFNDLRPHAVKIGMIGQSESVQAIADTLNLFPTLPIVLDPVMISTSGHRLADENTIGLMKTLLFPNATLLTPNLDEAAVLAGMEISTIAQMKTAAKKILDFGCNAVLIKGGHLSGNKLCDIYLDKTGREFSYENDKILSQNTHGTGCTLSSAIAAFIARGLEITVAIQNAESYVHQAIAQGSDVFIGQGKGPLNHFHNPIPLIRLKPDPKN